MYIYIYVYIYMNRTDVAYSSFCNKINYIDPYTTSFCCFSFFCFARIVCALQLFLRFSLTFLILLTEVVNVLSLERSYTALSGHRNELQLLAVSIQGSA